MESCEICGDDLRRYCSQGHVSGAGELFCDTCGELLPLADDQYAMTPAAPLAMDYSTGSFADFIAGGDEDPGGTPGHWPDVAVALVDAPGPYHDYAEPGQESAAEAEPEPLPEPEALLESEPLSEPEALLEPEPLPEPEVLVEPEALPEPEAPPEPQAPPKPE